MSYCHSDGLRDEYRAASVSVYDYYPFGMLMPGRVLLDTAGRCVTLTRDYTVPVNHWSNGGDLYTSGGVTTGATAVGSATVNQSATYTDGITVNGTSGGMLFTISNITSYSITLKLFFSALAGPVQVVVYSGIGTGGTQLGSVNVNYTAPATSLSLTGVTSPSNAHADITVVVSKAPGSGVYENPVDLFSLDSIGYNYTTYGLEYGLFTQCNSLSDKYEFGYNGQMKMNEIAGIGNHNSALFWEYSPQIGRRWNLDPVKQVSISDYASFRDNPIALVDPLGNVVVNADRLRQQNAATMVNNYTERERGFEREHGIDPTKGMTRREFLKAGGSKEEWRNYKDIQRELRNARRNEEHFKKQAEKTDRIIAAWKTTSPNIFKEVDEQAVDFLLESQPGLKETMQDLGITPFKVSGSESDPVPVPTLFTDYYPRPALSVRVDDEINPAVPEGFDKNNLQYTMNHEAGHFLYMVQHTKEYFIYIKKSGKADPNGHEKGDLSGVNADYYGKMKDK